MACVAGIGLVIGVLVSRHPRIALSFWIAVMIFVPVWISVPVLTTTLAPLNLATLLVLPAALRAATRQGRFGRIEAIILAFVTLASISFIFEGTPQFAFAAIFIQWLPAYFVGRYLTLECGREWVTKMVVASVVIVAIWSILEFVFDVHIFEALGDGVSGWNAIQERGPFTRSEGAFGHSIALGSFVALGIPFILSSQITARKRLLFVGLALAGTILTFSRGAIIGAVIALVAGVFSLPSLDLPKKLRRTLILAIVVLSFTLLPFVLSLFAGVSADLDPSTAYRANLATYIFADMQPFGPALNMEQARSGRYLYHGLGSIDNAYILAVLQFGWIPVLSLIFVLGTSVWFVLRRRNVNPAQVALVGQVWILGTVALITQYGMAVWFVAGLAVAFSQTPRTVDFPPKQMTRAKATSV
jgi:hypothetical protein